MSDTVTLVQERLARNSWGFLGTQGYVLGIDLGSYGLRAALINLHDHTYYSAQEEVRQNNPEQMVDAAINLGRGLMEQQGVTSDRLVRVGVGFGGPVDMRQGLVRLSPRQAGWESYPLAERFERAFDCTTLIDNDANLIALAESTFGSGRDVNHLFYLHISSGVGGGMVLDRRLYHGATYTAGEIGHAIVGHGWDGVGQPATLEQLISINGLLSRSANEGLQTDNLHDIFSSHPVGLKVVNEVVTLVAMRLAQVVALLDPEMIVLGGIVVRIGGDNFVQAIGARVNEFIAPQFARPVQVVSSLLGFDSVAVGALALALDSLCD